MQKYELTERDYDRIKSFACDKWKERSISYKDRSFLCKCYVDAIKSFLNSKNLIIKDGNFYKIDTQGE